MKWVEPAVLGSKSWAVIDDVPADDSSDGLPFDLDQHNALGDVVAHHSGCGRRVIQISDGFVRALAALPAERIAAVAERWATAEEWGGSWDRTSSTRLLKVCASWHGKSWVPSSTCTSGGRCSAHCAGGVSRQLAPQWNAAVVTTGRAHPPA